MSDALEKVPPSTGPSLVVAAAHDGAIGHRGGLPWHLPEDLAHFKRVTLGHAIVVGSTTWASIGRALPGRRMVVVSRRELEVPAGVSVRSSPHDALDWAESVDPSPVVAGGAQIYRALLDRVCRAYITEVAVSVAGADAHFAPLDEVDWVEVASWPGDDPRLKFRVLDRREGGKATNAQ